MMEKVMKCHAPWLRWSAVLLMALLGTSSALADRDDDDRGARREAYEIGLWGDLPYSDVQAQIGVPDMIADMNRNDLVFTVHDGDLKADSGTPGSVTPTTCSDAMYVQKHCAKATSTQCQKPGCP
jgi:hypothetical protein